MYTRIKASREPSSTMSKTSGNSIENQIRDQTDEPLKKRRRSTSTDELVEITNINAVNDDCLEHIFKKLSLDNLLNVAESCKRFQKIARVAFKSKYGKHLIYFGNCLGIADSISMDDEGIKVKNISLCLKIMRCFGASIVKLVIRFIYVSDEIQQNLDFYLNEYCADSVVDLRYGGRTLVNMTKSFNKIESVDIPNDSFQCAPTDVNRCFPRLRKLIMDSRYSVDCSLINIPNLEVLDIYVYNKNHYKFEEVLQINRQLRRLRTHGFDLDLDFLRFLSSCAKLESLSLSGRFGLAFNANPVPIHFKSVKKFKVSGYYLEWCNDANIYIFFDQLDMLTIESSWNDDVDNFMKNHQSISTFFFSGNFANINERKALECIKSLPSLTKLRLEMCPLSAENVVDVMRKCQLLKSFEFKLYTRNEYDILKNMLDFNWTASINQDRVVKLHR